MWKGRRKTEKRRVVRSGKRHGGLGFISVRGTQGRHSRSLGLKAVKASGHCQCHGSLLGPALC